jgi:glutaminyl-peptide cyclotransferase
MRFSHVPVAALAAGAIFSLLVAAPPQAKPVSGSGGTPVYSYRVVHVYPHDPKAFTQGLEYRDGFLYEGTGLNGQSTLRRVDLATGLVLQQIHLDSQYFGEGVTVFDQRILELTWQSHRGFVYDRGTFKLRRTFDYPGEGWGITNDGRRIFMSDGTPEIRVWNPTTLQEERRFTVRDGANPVEFLNELEYVRGEIYANVWQTDRIARISPTDGHVTGWIDLAGILSPADLAGGANVLNGIAWDAAGDRLFVTGKLWPKLFEIQLVKS